MRSVMRAQTLLEARWILLILVLAAVATWFISVWFTLVFLGFFLFTVAFFRDPDRPLPADPNLIVAPADGRVRDIVELDETEVLKTKTRRIGIFLSILMFTQIERRSLDVSFIASITKVSASMLVIQI